MKILVVEDELKTGNYLKQGLVEAGFGVDLARDGDDGLHYALTDAHGGRPVAAGAAADAVAGAFLPAPRQDGGTGAEFADVDRERFRGGQNAGGEKGEQSD